MATLDACYTTFFLERALRAEAELCTEWKTPTFDPARDSQVIVGPDGAVAGWIEVYDYEPHVTFPSRLRMAPHVLTPAVQYLVE